LNRLEPAVLRAARDALDHPGISVVDAALTAAELGATGLHDPTEGGLAAGLHKLARASSIHIRVDRGTMLWFEPGRAVCFALGVDRWVTLASGCLLASFPPDRAETAVRALRAEDHPSAIVGVAETGSGVDDVEDDPIEWPERDEVARVVSTRS
jgi:hydrogenase expression/formation protein HypE